jgi:hypothetical protein
MSSEGDEHLEWLCKSNGWLVGWLVGYRNLLICFFFFFGVGQVNKKKSVFIGFRV